MFDPARSFPDNTGMWWSVPLVILVSTGAAGLTFFSGFGLGTLLLPVFALIFPVSQAVALTAVVHLLNNLFKFTLTLRHIQWRIVLWFGVPAIVAAYGGAHLLLLLGEQHPLGSYSLGNRTIPVAPINLLIAILILVFVLIESLPQIRSFTVEPRYLPIGGILSGFFGGLSGHQGAFRTIFLLKTGLGKEAFIATGIVIAVAIDLTRLATYLEGLANPLRENLVMVLSATVAAFVGSWFGNRYLKKTTLVGVQRMVSILLIVMAVGLGSGLLTGH